jgi:oxalate decarboxylase/phosphoglucose isomerase-like protein (cupin superfamily)
VIYLPRHSCHTIRNTSGEEPLEFLTIWWGSPEANSRMVDMARSLIAAEGSTP